MYSARAQKQSGQNKLKTNKNQSEALADVITIQSYLIIQGFMRANRMKTIPRREKYRRHDWFCKTRIYTHTRTSTSWEINIPQTLKKTLKKVCVCVAFPVADAWLNYTIVNAEWRLWAWVWASCEPIIPLDSIKMCTVSVFDYHYITP